MAQRGRRPVLQLDDVSSSHSSPNPRPRTFAAAPEEVTRKKTFNPLLSLVSYASDDSSASSDENSDDNDNRSGDSTPPSLPSSTKEKQKPGDVEIPEDTLPEIPLPPEAEPAKPPDLDMGPEPPPEPELKPEPEPELKPELKPESELLKSSETEISKSVAESSESVRKVEMILESMLDIPLPETSAPVMPSAELKKDGGGGGGMESELASFFAEIKEIESTTTENPPPDNEEDIPLPPPPSADLPPSTNELPPAVDSSQSEIADLGFILRPDASVSPAPEEKREASPAKEKAKPSSSSAQSAYQSMFVKGAPEFVRKEKEGEEEEEEERKMKKGENGEEVEDLPEEPTSEWQMVQDDSSGYYYYWNMVSNQVTWEIPPGYTQYLLLLKEYQDRVSTIPKEKLQRIKDRKKQGESSGRESSPAPSSSSSSSRQKKEKKHKKHRKEKPEPPSTLPQSVEIGPQLPPMLDKHRKEEPEPPSTLSQSMEIGPQLPPTLDKKNRKEKPELPSTLPQSMEIGPQLPPTLDKKHRKEKPESPSTLPQSMEIGPQLPPTLDKKHRKEKPESPSTLPQSMEIGPQLPPMLDGSSSNVKVKVKADQSEAETTEADAKASSSSSPPPAPSSDNDRKETKGDDRKETKGGNKKKTKGDDRKETKGGNKKETKGDDRKETKGGKALDSAADSTSVFAVPQDVEAIFDEALSVVTEGLADSSKPDPPKPFDMFREDDDHNSEPVSVLTPVTSSSAVEASPAAKKTASMDVITSSSSFSVDGLKPVSVEASKSGSSPEREEGDPSVTPAGNSACAVSTSSLESSSASLPKAEGGGSRADLDLEEGEVSNSGVKDVPLPGAEEEEEEDEFDMDFDDIDDLDRALEKALEKKLEKKKAELEKLEEDEDMTPSDSQPVSSALHIPSSQSECTAPVEAESTVSSSVKAAHSPAPTPSDKRGADSTEARSSGSLRPKRSAAQSTSARDGQGSAKKAPAEEPVVKKARLVAYDAAESDEEMDGADEVSSGAVESTPKPSEDISSGPEVSSAPPPEPDDNLAEIEEMASTACAKLAFLDVTVDGLTPLQTSLIALQTRMTDWQNGGLKGDYFFQRLKEVNRLLTHYESRAVPAGWTCQWDRYAHFYLSFTCPASSPVIVCFVSSATTAGLQASCVYGPLNHLPQPTKPPLVTAPELLSIAPG